MPSWLVTDHESPATPISLERAHPMSGLTPATGFGRRLGRDFQTVVRCPLTPYRARSFDVSVLLVSVQRGNSPAAPYKKANTVRCR